MTEATIVEVEAVTETVFDGVAPGAELDVDGVGEFLGEARFDSVSEGYRDCEAVFDAVVPVDLTAVGVPLVVLLEDGVGVSDADGD